MHAARRPAVWVAALTAAMSLGVMEPAVAATTSHLVVTNAASTEISSVALDATTSTMTVTVGLDDSCPSAYGTGQVYGIAAASAAPAVATVSPHSVSGLHCADAATFMLAAVANGVTTITFDPVAANPGLQKKLVKTVLTVTVTGLPTDGNDGTPPAHKRPAAPAVAKAYLGNPQLVAACRSTYTSKAWRGRLLSAVARWSARNHLSKQKNDLSVYPTDNDWVRTVQRQVDTFCHWSPGT